MSPQIKLTYEDFLLFPEDGKRHEIIGGEHFMTPSPVTNHQRISRRLTYFLDSHLQRTKAGEMFYAPMDVVLSDTDVLEPDIHFISDAKSSIIGEKNIQGAPDLVVEILSEGTRRMDALTKRKLYERSGILEYWIVDPELETVDVYRLDGEKYVRAAELSREAGHVIETPLLPGLRIPLAEIFA